MSKLSGNILILTHWSFNDALVQTYTLPYVNIIRRILPPERKIFLVTSEQAHLALADEEVHQINERWKKANIILVAQPYQAMGASKVIASVKHLQGLYKLMTLQVNQEGKSFNYSLLLHASWINWFSPK
jgi:hypothetical protein